MSTVAPAGREKGHCPECGPDRQADMVGHYRNRFDDEENQAWGVTDYRILKCRGCETVYFQQDAVYSEDEGHRQNPSTGEWETYLLHKITHWPAPSKRKRPDWSNELWGVDSDLDSLIDDIYVALNNSLGILAAIGMRTAFDRASELLGVDPAKGFAEKLGDLVKLGKIGESERTTLDTLTDAGSAAAHRGWKPKTEELDMMIRIIEQFLYRAFILDEAAKGLSKKIPAKQKRTKANT